MDVREARLDDAPGIRRVARDSFASSYDAVFDEAAIDRLVDDRFDDEGIAALDDEADQRLLVAVDEEGVAGFAQGVLIGDEPTVGDVRWLHVHPDDRRQDVGVRLLGELVRRFETDEAAFVRGSVLAGNEDGGDFFGAYGFDRRDTEPVEIDGEAYEETIYEHRLDDEVGEEIVESVAGPDGADLYVDYSGGEAGTEAPFYPLYSDESLTDRYGWQCSNCGSAETSMDADGRVQCAHCENVRTAQRWDGAYL